VINLYHQGMYPTIIVIVVAMRLSTADVLSRPGAEANSAMVFKPMPPNPLPQMAEDVEASQDVPISMTVSSDVTSI